MRRNTTPTRRHKHRYQRGALLTACLTVLAMLALLAGSSGAATTGPSAPSVPSPDVLNVNFANGTADQAQGLAAQTWGSPSVAKDATLGQNVATFNGTSDGYSYPFSAQWPKLTSGFSFECQVRYNGGTLPPSGSSAGLCGDTYAGGAIIEAYSGQVSFAVEVNGVYIFTEAAINPGTWYDITGTWNGTTADLYVDGSLAMSVPASGTLTIPESDAQNFFLGADANLANGLRTPAPSSLATARVWSTPLSAGQVAAQYQASPVPPVTAPAADILNANFSSGNPVDYAQALPDTKWGSPTIANDSTEGHDVATFDGSSGYTFPSTNQWNKLAAGFSIECKFKYNGTIPTATQNVVCGDTHSGGFSIINNYGQLALQANIGGGYQFAQTPSWVTGQWYDVVGTWDGHYARLYVNGQLQAATATSGSLADPSVDDFTVGADAPQGGAVNYTSTSSVDEYKVWDSALSPAQVAAEYSNPAPTGAGPSPSILDVKFNDNAPVDYAQGLAETTYGTPSIANDPTLDTDVATFNGSSGYTFDSTNQWSRLSTGFSIQCIFKYNGSIPTTTQNVVCGDTHSGGFSIINDYGQLALQVNTGGTYRFAQTPSFVAGQWYDALGTWDGSNARLYVNGQLAATTATSGSLTDPSVDDFTVGADAPQGGNVNFTSTSTVASYEIWDTVLSANQTAANPVTVTTQGKGTASASVAVATEGQPVTLTEQAAAGYHFSGWTVTPSSVTVGSGGTFTMPGQAVTATADFAPNTYTVHFDGNGAGGGATGDETLTYDNPANLTANGYTDPGHYFAGWATTPNGPPVYSDGQSVDNLTATDGATVTLYAVWIVNGNYVVQVSSGADGSASVDNFSHAPGDTVTLTASPDTGYHLANLKVTSPSDGSVTVAGNGNTGTFTMPSENVSVTATFAPNTYTVHYDGNGASDGSMSDGTFTYDQSQTLAPNGFARDNYRFDGWATSANGPVAYPDMASVSNLTAADGGTVTLYAQWSKLAVQPGSWSSLPAGFVTANFHLPAATVSGAVSQPLLGLWNGAAPTSFTKVSGDSWLSISADGTVTGTAPADVPQHPGEITVSATNGTTTSQILVQVPVDALHASPQMKTASWNAWNDGKNVTDAVGKNLAVIASQDVNVIGFQGGGYAMAQSVGSALGWQVHGNGDLGIVSAYPFTTAKTVYPTSSAPAAAVTIDVEGQPVRIWDVHLDQANSGPDNACFNGVTNPSTLISDEEATTRYTQAKAVAQAMAPDIDSSTPVVLLGDLASPSGADWTAATSASHCNVGAVDWPVPDVFAAAGLTDTFRAANPDPVTDPGNTWSPVVTTNSNGQPEPHDRIDYVDATGAGGLTVQQSDTLTVGWPSATDAAGNGWASNHAAVATTFTVHGTSPGPAPQPTPAVTVTHDTIAYQVNNGPAGNGAFLTDVGAAATPGNATLDVDLGTVNFSTPGWYTALVTATRAGVVSDPVAVTVRVAPVPGLTLGRGTATFATGDSITQAAVLAQLEPVLDVAGAVKVDLSGVDTTAAGTYPVTVTATDTWGFTVTQPATVTVTAGSAALSPTTTG